MADSPHQSLSNLLRPSKGGPLPFHTKASDRAPALLSRSDRALDTPFTSLPKAVIKRRSDGTLSLPKKRSWDEFNFDEEKAAEDTRVELSHLVNFFPMEPQVIRDARKTIVLGLVERVPLSNILEVVATAEPDRPCSNVGCDAYHISEDCPLEPLCVNCGAYGTHYAQDCAARCSRCDAIGHSAVYCQRHKHSKLDRWLGPQPRSTPRRPANELPRQIGDVRERILAEVARLQYPKYLDEAQPEPPRQSSLDSKPMAPRARPPASTQTAGDARYLSSHHREPTAHTARPSMGQQTAGDTRYLPPHLREPTAHTARPSMGQQTAGAARYVSPHFSAARNDDYASYGQGATEMGAARARREESPYMSRARRDEFPYMSRARREDFPYTSRSGRGRRR